MALRHPYDPYYERKLEWRILISNAGTPDMPLVLAAASAADARRQAASWAAWDEVPTEVQIESRIIEAWTPLP